MILTEEEKRLIKIVVDNFENEDRDARDRQIRTYRKLKLLWEGFQRTWYSEVAHDWRIYDEQQDNSSDDQDYYNKPINVFRAYLESIISALSVVIPPIKCYPDDADNPLDIQTAKAGDKIAELISKHNNVSLLWLHALYTYCTEGMVACYNYTDEDEKYGTYKEDKYENVEEETETKVCSSCGAAMASHEEDEFDPEDSEETEEICESCLAQMTPTVEKKKVIVNRLVGVTSKPKARQCIEVYGGLYVKIANYAKCQKDTPYLGFSYEANYATVREWYKDDAELREKIQPGMGNPVEPYAKWGRNNPQYQGEIPTDTVTVRNYWLRPAAFQILNEVKEYETLIKKFPNGCKAVFIEQEFAEACDESLDDHWTITQNPLSDFLNFDPVGLLLVSVQEITNDIVSLTLQTIEHGIGQTFADPSVVNFDAYRQSETIPGGIYPTNRLPGGKNIKDGFFELKTASLSSEVMPFSNQIQEYGQLVSGALPSLFGGQVSGSGTASEYSMSRNQASQRLGSTWKMFTVWWKEIYGKVIPAYIKTVQEDERIVKKDDFGNFVNVLIRKSELEGKIGSVEIEANENLPMSWSQRRDVLMKLMETNNQQLLALLAQPENLPLIYDALGIVDLYIPGEDDRNKQYDEIKKLLNSEAIPIPLTPEDMIQAEVDGIIPEEREEPSVEVDPLMDNHAIEFEICRKFAISEAGQQAKVDNPEGYKNFLLHAVQHKQLILPPAGMGSGAAPLESPTQDKSAPIKGDSDVPIEA